MRKHSILTAALLAIATSSFAGGYLTNTNQSIYFLRIRRVQRPSASTAFTTTPPEPPSTTRASTSSSIGRTPSSTATLSPTTTTCLWLTSRIRPQTVRGSSGAMSTSQSSRRCSRSTTRAIGVSKPDLDSSAVAVRASLMTAWECLRQWWAKTDSPPSATTSADTRSIAR